LKTKVIFLTFFLTLVSYLAQKSPSFSTPLPKVNQQISAQNETLGLPIRLKIPQINVDAAIEYVGLTSNGAMDVPQKIENVGWFKFGPHPGQRGSAVIAGHFNGPNGEDGVFINLYKLKSGDKIYTENEKGSPITFVVRESRLYDPGYADDVFNQSDGAHLNLITCDGVWDGVKKSYSKRLVVFTDLVLDK